VAAPSFNEPCFVPCEPVFSITGIEPSHDASGIPLSFVTLAVGFFGLLIGTVWMWKLYRAPTRFEGAHWRFHDH
jgi:hypothetical protein